MGWIIVLSCVALLLRMREATLQPATTPRLDVFPTSRGASALLTSPDGRRILIGAGGDASILEHLGRAMPFLARGIDVLVVTGETESKQNAAMAVLERYRVGTVILAQTGAVARVAERRGTAIQPAVDGLTIELLGARLVLGLDRQGFPSAARIDGDTQTALLLADFPSDDERRLLLGGGDMHADILLYKNGRQTTEDLLGRIQPTFGVMMGSGARMMF
jgi:beta-lactamase superfamily II metal-dependent hydrolase